MMFKVPLSKEELDKTVLRKDIINALDKQAESKRRADPPSDAAGMSGKYLESN